MANKFGKLVVFSALAGAVAAGTYYLLQKKQDEPLKDFDSSDDFDDFDDDLDDDTEETTSDNTHSTKNRSYVSLDLEGAKEVIGEKVIETLDKAKEFVEEKMATPSNSEAPTSNVSSTYAAEEPVNSEEFFDDSKQS